MHLIIVRFHFVVTLVAATFGIAGAAFPANETSHLNVFVPASLHSGLPNGMRHKMSNFGRHPAVGSLHLPVYFYFELCEFPIDPSKGYPPRSTDPKTGKQRRFDEDGPFMLMTPRGGCTFATKARHAQASGASAVIIADTTCLCDDKTCMSNNTWKNDGTCEAHEPVMADDGSGGDITIPGFLIYKDDATPLKEAIVDKHQSVLMGVRWHKPHSDTVRFGLWMDFFDEYTKKLFQDIGPIVNALGDRGSFYPHYMLHNGSRTNCGGAGGNGSGSNESVPQLCENMCTNNGRYCYPTHHYNGTAVVVEILRRACIWKHHGPEKGDVGAKWWQYVTYFDEKCRDSFAVSEKCMIEALKHAAIPKIDVDNCMMDSGDPIGDDPNTLLDAMLRSQQEYGIITAPRLWANHRVLDDPTASALLTAICDVSDPGTKFSACTQCLHNKDPVACVAKKYGTAKLHSRTFHIWLWSGLLVSIAFFFYAYKRYQEGEGAGLSGLNPMAYAMLRDQSGDGGFEPVTSQL
jgi:hypothetical protein